MRRDLDPEPDYDSGRFETSNRAMPATMERTWEKTIHCPHAGGDGIIPESSCDARRKMIAGMDKAAARKFMKKNEGEFPCFQCERRVVKKCFSCNRLRPITDFPEAYRTPHRLADVCNDCYISAPKTCVHCGRSLPRSEYPKDLNAADARGSRCLSCGQKERLRGIARRKKERAEKRARERGEKRGGVVGAERG